MTARDAAAALIGEHMFGGRILNERQCSEIADALADAGLLAEETA